MRAAVVEALGGLPIVEEFADPTGDDVAEVVAAALNPFDLIVAAGQMPARQPSPPFIAGIEGIARLSDGTLSYFANPRLPYGSLAELVPLAGADTATVPAGLDPAFAAALGVSGIAAWLSLTNTGRLMPGERVLILGAEGQVGQLATQLARPDGRGAGGGCGPSRREPPRGPRTRRRCRRVDGRPGHPDRTAAGGGRRRRRSDPGLGLGTGYRPCDRRRSARAPGSSRSATPQARRRRSQRPSCATSWSASCRTPTGPSPPRSAPPPSNSSPRTPRVARCASTSNACRSTTLRRRGRGSRPAPPPASSS